MQPNFVGHFTQSEATAAQRTFCFFAPDVTDGFTAETTLDYEDAAADVQVSKNGGAFANATGVVTEVAAGVYQYVAATAELDTIGTVVWKFVDAAARTVFCQAQVIALDLNTATVNPGAGGITSASFAAGAIDAAALATDAIGTAEIAAAVTSEIQNGLATAAAVAALARGQHTDTRTFTGELTTDDDVVATSMLNAIDCVVQLSGTWDSATVTIQTSENPEAGAGALWTTIASGAKTDDAVVTVTGPHSAVRCIVSDDGASTDVDCTFLVRYAN